MKQIITYQGNCPRCGKVQEGKKSEVDIDCWNCSVNANLERHDIIRNIESTIMTSGGNLIPGLEKALEIIRKYDRKYD